MKKPWLSSMPPEVIAVLARMSPAQRAHLFGPNLPPALAAKAIAAIAPITPGKWLMPGAAAALEAQDLQRRLGPALARPDPTLAVHKTITGVTPSKPAIKVKVKRAKGRPVIVSDDEIVDMVEKRLQENSNNRTSIIKEFLPFAGSTAEASFIRRILYKHRAKYLTPANDRNKSPK